MTKKFLISTIGKKRDIFESLKVVAEHFRFNSYLYVITNEADVKENYRDIRNFLVGSQKIKEGEDLNCLLLKNIEDFEKIYKELEEKRLEDKIKNFKNKGWKIYLDYTYATKAISGQILFYLVNKRLADFVVYVSGTRKNGIVVANFTPRLFNLSQFYLEQDWRKIISFIKSFRFDSALSLVNHYNIDSTIKNLLEFYTNLLFGKFEQIAKKKIRGGFDNFLNINEEKIFEIKSKVKSYLKAKKENLIEEILKFEMGYFYDLIHIHFLKKEYPQVLALFCSFLDKYLTYELFHKKQILKNDYEFDFQQANIVFRDKFSAITGKKTPVSLSLKIDEFLRMKRIKEAGIKEDMNIDFNKLKELIEKRNNSIFGHGFYFPDEFDGKKAVELAENIISDLKIEKGGKYFFYYPTDVKFSSIIT